MPGEKSFLMTGVLFAGLITAVLTKTVSGPLWAFECYNGGNIKLNLTCETGVISIQWNETYLGCSQTLCPDIRTCDSTTDCKVLVSDSEHSTGNHWTELNGCNEKRNCQIRVVHSARPCFKPASNYEVVTYWCVTPEEEKPASESATDNNMSRGGSDASVETSTVYLELSTVGDPDGRRAEIQGKTVAIVVVTALLLTLLLVCIYICCRKRKRRRSLEREPEDLEHGDKESSRREMAGTDKLDRAFSYISRRTTASYNLYEAVRFSNASAAPPGRYRPSTVRKPEPPPLRTLNEIVDETELGTVDETKPRIAKTAHVAPDSIVEQINPKDAPHPQHNNHDVAPPSKSVNGWEAENTGGGEIYEDIDGEDCYADVLDNNDIYVEPDDDTDASVKVKPTASEDGDYDTVVADTSLYDVADGRVRRLSGASQDGDIIDDDDMILEENDLYNVSDIEESVSNTRQTSSQDNELYHERDDAASKAHQLTSQDDDDNDDDDDDDDMELADNDLYDMAEAIQDAAAIGRTDFGLEERGGDDVISDGDDVYDGDSQDTITERSAELEKESSSHSSSAGNTAVQSASSAIPDTFNDDDDDDGYDPDDDQTDDDDDDENHDNDHDNDDDP